MIKIGILGLGRIAGHHVKAISKNKKIKIAAACDLNFTKRDSFSIKHKVKCYSHYDLMLKAHPEIDIVAIMSPSGMHYEHALKILNKFRKHLIIEKPTTLRTSNLKKCDFYFLGGLSKIITKFKIIIPITIETKYNVNGLLPFCLLFFVKNTLLLALTPPGVSPKFIS